MNRNHSHVCTYNDNNNTKTTVFQNDSTILLKLLGVKKGSYIEKKKSLLYNFCY